MREHTPYPDPVDVTFIIEREDPLLIPELLSAAQQQDKDSPAPYHLWSFFFREGFLSRFDRVRGKEGLWSRNNDNIYRRHPWNQRTGLPQGWEGAMDGFRRLAIRWWRRNLLRTYRGWIRRQFPGVALLPKAKKYVNLVCQPRIEHGL